MNVPPWGWPWHGAVDTSNVLHLPGGMTMPYFPPSRANHTYRVKVPGVAAVVRSPEELAADTALGREWRNEALMQAYMLYGRELGGWIYSAPDDTRWIIRLTGTAVRFGILSGAAVEQAITVAWPTDDIEPGEEIGISGAPYLVQRWPLPVDISPDGSRAIFMLYANDPSFNVGLRPLPLGFQLVTVSGETGAISVAITTLRTMEQTLGEVVFADDRVIGGPGVSTGTMASYVNNRILALWFNPAGVIIECTVDYRRDLTLDFPEFEELPPEPGSSVVRYARIATRFLRDELALMVDGVKVYTFWRTDSRLMNNYPPYYPNARHEYEWELDDGRGEFTDYVDDSVLLEDPLTAPNDLVRLYVSDQWRLLSNNIAVLLRRYNEGGGPHVQYFGCATPQGVVTLSGLEPGGIAINKPAGALERGCFNPFTGEVSDPAGDTVTFV